MTPAFDHLVLLVPDLEDAVRDFRALGFVVRERADTRAGKARFRFIPFADGSYILLMAFADAQAQRDHRLGPVLDEGAGWADYSFTLPSVADTAQVLAAAGHPVRGPVRVANVLQDGSEWALDLLMTGCGAGGDAALPFVVNDVTGREFRIPAPPDHPNGAVGIHAIVIASHDPARASGALTLMGGCADPVAEGFRVRFGAGHVDVIAHDPAAGHRAAGGIVSATLLTRADVSPRGLDLDPDKTHGARIRLIRETEEDR